MINLSITVSDNSAFVAIGGLPDKMKGIFEAKFRELLTVLKDKVIENLSGKVLQTKTGALLKSIREEMVIEEDAWIGEVYVADEGNVKAYARTLEYGGKGSYVIVPINKRALAFSMGIGSSYEFTGYQKVFAARVVRKPEAAHSYLRSALRDFAPMFREGLEEAINEAIE